MNFVASISDATKGRRGHRRGEGRGANGGKGPDGIFRLGSLWGSKWVSKARNGSLGFLRSAVVVNERVVD